MVETDKFIFIANPKTGSISVESFIIENDKSSRKGYFLKKKKKIDAFGHINASEIKKIIGSEYDKEKVIAIIREPISKFVSSYFFYKNGKPIMKGNKNPWPARLRIIFARLLPFSLWSLLYPYKSNKSFITDNNGRIIVGNIIIFENLQNDFSKILKKFGVDYYDILLPHKNKSKHNLNYNYYLKNPIHRYLLLNKLKQDIEFYNKFKKIV